MVLTISNAINLNRIIQKVALPQTNYPIGVAYAVYKTIKELDEVEKFTFERFSLLFGDNISDLTDEKKAIYDAIMQDTIEISNPSFSMDDLLKPIKKVELSISEVAFLNQFIG